MNSFLKLKSWQTFGLIVVIPLLFMIIGVLLTKTTGIQSFMNVFALLATLTIMISYYGWILSAGIILNEQVESDKKQNITAFKSLFVIALMLFLIFIPILKNVSDENLTLTRFVGLVAFVCFLYCIYFVAKSISQVEKQLNIKPKSLFPDFILIWLLPIGIWTIQPRISRILAEK